VENARLNVEEHSGEVEKGEQGFAVGRGQKQAGWGHDVEDRSQEGASMPNVIILHSDEQTMEH
jgi:hypothetical protein